MTIQSRISALASAPWLLRARGPEGPEGESVTFGSHVGTEARRAEVPPKLHP